MTQEAMTEENIGLVHFVIKKHFNYVRYCEYEDMFQIGCMGLWKAVRLYKPDKATFATFAVPWIYNAIRGYLRDEKRRTIPCISLDIKLTQDESITLVDTIKSDVDVEESGISNTLFKTAFENLTQKQKEIVRLKYLGYSQKQIAKKVCCAQPTVSKILLKIKKEVI